MTGKQLPLFPDSQEHPQLSRRASIKDALPVFQEHLRREGRSPHTINAFTSDLQLLIEFAGENNRLGEITTSDLNRFMEWIEHGRGIPCSRKSYARRVTTLKVFFAFLKNERIIANDPASDLLQRSGAAPLQPILSQAQVECLLLHTAALRVADEPDARPDMLLRLLLDTGIKKSEAMVLTPASINRSQPEKPILTVRYRKRKNVYKERNILLDPDWLNVLDEYLIQYKPPEGLFDCTARNLEYVLHNIAREAGVDAKISFEILRWTGAVRDYQRGVDLDALREKMGLSRISWRETSDKIVRLTALQQMRDEPGEN